MSRNDLQTQLKIARKDVDKARAALETAEKHLKELDEQIKEADKQKPVMCLKYNWSIPICFEGHGSRLEITHYVKFSDQYIEFDAYGFKYRYIEKHESERSIYPPIFLNKTIHYYKYRDYVFEIYDFASGKYIPVDYIDHIELLEGVDEYDKN